VEVYILDSLYRRIQVVDRFESLIWTERFKDFGDFELKTYSTLENRNRFTVGTRLAMNKSHRVMTVETVEDTTDDEGARVLYLKGRSLEYILEDRAARPSVADLTALPQWIIADLPPVAIAKKIFHDTCILGGFSSYDIIPNVVEGPGLYPEDTIAEPSANITVAIDPTSVYGAIKQLADLYDFGFRLIRNYDTSQFFFDVYMGSDRTTGQNTLPAVIFSPNLDNLKNTTELTSIAGYKNVAYVLSPVGNKVVYPDDIDPDFVTGLDRHVLWVDASDITDPTPATLDARLTQRGKEELSKNRQFSAFDGEISQVSQYIYGVDFNLGDLVEMQNTDGATNQMQVTEQIFVQDREGERSYPTLSRNKFITPGAWSAWDFNQVWFDLDSSSETWADQV
jgi:hypothetical protein